MSEKRSPLRFQLLARLLPLCLLLVWGQAMGQEQPSEYVGPQERAKDLTAVYGRYEIYEAVEYGYSFGTTATEAQAQVGQELIVTADLFRFRGDRIENPTYTVWFYPDPPEEGWVVPRNEWWSSMYGLSEGQAGGDEILKVYKPGAAPNQPSFYLDFIGTNELWVKGDGWYFKTRKTTHPVLSAGHDDYCQVMGPCSAGQGDCDSDSECQSELTCVDGRGASYGFAATVGVCEALRGAVEGVSRLHSGPLTLYGWAYNTAASTTSIPIEIYVGGARGTDTGTLATTITADQPRPDINTAEGITGNHGFAWAVPTQYQSSAQSFYIYAVDQSPNPTVHTQLSPDSAPLTLRAVGTAAYCQHHGPCIVDQGDCTSNAECQSGLQCVANAGANHGFGATIGVCEGGGSWTFCSSTRRCRAGLGDCDLYGASQCESGLTCAQNVGANYGHDPIVDVCEATSNGAEDHCLTTKPCAAGKGDCDNDAECASGTTCVEDVGASYNLAADVDVCVASTTVSPGVTTTQTQSIYRRATTTPSAPSGGTSTETHVPSGWSTSQPTPTTTQGVYESQRTATSQGGVFQSATAWGTPTLVAQIQSIYRRATSTPSTPSGGTSTENHVPSGWSTSQPSATTTEGVYRSQRTLTYQGGVFQVATAWGTPTRVTAPTGSGLRGYVDVVSRLNSGPLTLYGWAYNTAASTANIPVEIYVGGARGTGTLAATITADQPRADVNTAHGITGDHGYEWVVPTQYQSGAQSFYVYALNRSPNPTVRAPLHPAPLNLLALGAADYCADHGPCAASQGDCDSNSECQSGTVCTNDVGATYGFGANIDVCVATLSVGHADYCRDHGPCSAGQGDCDSNGECQSGLTCVNDVGATYGFSAITDVCEVPTTQTTQSIYRRATSTPFTPSGGTSTENQVPSGWSTTQPQPTTTHGVYRSQRTVTYQGGVFQSATAWGTPTRVAAPTVSVGHANYCRDQGPCSVGQGDCDSNSECQSGLTCVNDIGASYGFSAITDVCETSSWTWNNLSTQALTVGDRAGDLLSNNALNFTYAGSSYHIQHLQVSRPAGSQENQVCVRTDDTFAQAVLDNLEIRIDLDGSTNYVEANFSADLVAAGYYCFTIQSGGRSTFTNSWRTLGSDNTIDVVIRHR